MDFSVYQAAEKLLSQPENTPRQTFSLLVDSEGEHPSLHTMINDVGLSSTYIHFCRVLYRFYLALPELRSAYLDEIFRHASLDGQRLIIYCCDRIEIGEYDTALQLLEDHLDELNTRWKIRALFQIVRIAVLEPRFTRRAYPHALVLRSLLEEDFQTSLANDRSTKYALCSIFITLVQLQKMKGITESRIIEKADQEICVQLGELLNNPVYWDAC